MKILDQHCEAVNRDPTEIERCAVALLFLSEDEKYLKRIREAEIGTPAIIGTVNELRDVIGAYDEAGVEELIIPDFTLGTLIGSGQRKKDLMEKFICEVATVAT